MRILLRWAINALVLLGIPYVLESVRVESLGTALVTALALGLVNALIRPLLILLTLPITLITLGLFTLVINALLFWGVAKLVGGVYVPDFWTAFWSALLYSFLSWLVNIALASPDDKRVRVVVGRRRQ